MADRLKLIDIPALEKQVRADIVTYGILNRVHRAVVRWMVAWNESPKAVNRRIADLVASAVSSTPGAPELRYVGYSKNNHGGPAANTATIDIVFDTPIGEFSRLSYNLRFDGARKIDTGDACLPHCNYAIIMATLADRLDGLPAKAEEFNTALRTLHSLREFGAYPMACPGRDATVQSALPALYSAFLYYPLADINPRR
jgi:hypothetical protein